MCLSLQIVSSSFCPLYSSGIRNTEILGMKNLGNVEGCIDCSVAARIVLESQGKHGV